MYKILIKRVEAKKYTDRSYEKIADSGNEGDGGSVYGYVEYPSEKEIETVILEQTLDTLDITAVIKAINKIN